MEPQIIKGGKHTDHRGTLNYFNDFDMVDVSRFYIIEHSNTEVKRGWRAHKLEQRWFTVSSGSFVVKLVKIDNWEEPNKNAEQLVFRLNALDAQILHLPKGYASCLQATEPNSKIIAFGDSKIENAGLDDYLYPVDYFNEY